MYNTPLGIRVLQGAERRLFVESLAMIVDDLSVCDGDWGVAVFDRLQRNAKIAVLLAMARGLLCGREQVPPLTAAIEASVATVFGHVLAMISMELDEEFGEPRREDAPHLPSWRELILAAGREAELSDLPNMTEDDPGEWEFVLERLEDRVLWDRDWEIEEHLDADPEVSQQVKQAMGIHEEYFIAVPPDPTDAEAERLLLELRELTAEAR